MYMLKKDQLNTSLSDEKRQWEAYECYLYRHKENFPASAYTFATASWHYDPQHHHCPHDSWLESVVITELSEGLRNDAANQGDWLCDEVRVSDAGRVIHEIEWVHGQWLIECRDISVNWRDAPRLT